MNILELIKKRRTIRKYRTKRIPKTDLHKIIEAARWAPSAHNCQSWKFILVESKNLKQQIITQLKEESSKYLTSFKILFKNTLSIMENAPLVIFAYNTKSLSNKAHFYGEPYYTVSHVAEIQGIAAAIQNMHLTACSLGIGMAWLSMPLFARLRINKILHTGDELVAVLTLGFPAEKGKKTARKRIDDIAMEYVE